MRMQGFRVGQIAWGNGILHGTKGIGEGREQHKGDCDGSWEGFTCPVTIYRNTTFVWDLTVVQLQLYVGYIAPCLNRDL